MAEVQLRGDEHNDVVATKSSEGPNMQQEALKLLEIGSEHRLRSENLPFDIDVWYPLIAQFTFPTIFLPFTRREAVAIMNYQETRYNERDKLTKEDVRVLRELEHRIGEALKNDIFRPAGAFMRLCGRSPKDGEPLDREGLVRRYNEELKKMLDAGAPMCANTKLRAIAKVSSLRVNSAAEAMNLLLTSERVFADLHDWIRWGEPEQIVLRQWQPGMSLEFEFRAYVNNNKVTAISQYDHYCIYPDLEGMKEMLQEKIMKMWEIVHPYVGEESYVIDFVYLPDEDRVTVIELSPFRTCTGAATFSWKNDKELLENGPFEFRLNTKTHPSIEELVETNWDDRWKKPSDPYYKLYQPFEKQQNGGGFLPSLFSWLKSDSDLHKEEKKTHLLFVYGTLRKGYHWNSKFLSLSKYIGPATTVKCYPLVVGESGVPYLLADLPDQGKQIKGEIWQIDDVTLQGLDEYEGIGKGYYCRLTVEVKPTSPTTTSIASSSTVNAQVYFKTKSSEALRQHPFLEEYTLEFHKKNYKAIKHIQVKQKMYLGEADETKT